MTPEQEGWVALRAGAESYKDEALDLACRALAAEHDRRPPFKVIDAAVGYVIREQLGETILEALRDSEVTMRWDPATRELAVLLDPHNAADPCPMLIARVPVKGEPEYL